MTKSNRPSDDFLKEAAEHLRSTVQTEYGRPLGSSHAHAAVAGALGYKSKIALLESQEIDVDDPFLARKNTLDENTLGQVMSRMHDLPLKGISAADVERIIADGLTPGCSACGEKTARSLIVGYSDFGGYPDEPEFVCPDCARDEEEFGHCTYCGDQVLYRLEQLNRNGECENHAGESDLSPEEEEDMDSYIDYNTKDGD